MEGYVRKILAAVWRFRLLPVLKRKKKVVVFSATLPLAGVVGTEREIECQIYQKSFPNRSRERKETCLKPFSNRVSGSERNEGKSPVPIRSVGEAPTGAALSGY